MFTIEQKQHIASEIQRLLRETADPNLPIGEIQFILTAQGMKLNGEFTYGFIHNNGNKVCPNDDR